MKKFAILLSGCGFKDGSEITESVSTLIALSEARAQYQIFAPDLRLTAVNHLTGQKEGERSTLAESARIARGEVQNLTELNPNKFDGLILPGGYGAATLLCDFATSGASCKAHPLVEKIIQDFYKLEKPIAAFCIAPALVARVLGSEGITVTIGNDHETAKEIEKTGASHVNCEVTDFITDREKKIITSPAYMYKATPFQVYTGIRKAIVELVEMA
jgi:enhancing lycopene biosynthesis protein 2